MIFDLNRVTLGDLNRLQAYCKLRNRSKFRTGKVLALVFWLRITAQADLETVVNKIALALNRKDGWLIDLLTGKYPDLAKKPLEKLRKPHERRASHRPCSATRLDWTALRVTELLSVQ